MFDKVRVIRTIQFSTLYGPIYGSLYFATILSTAFYGVTCMQTFFYYVHYPSDPLRTKALVMAVWAFNSIHEALVIAGAYKCIMGGLELGAVALLTGIPELVLIFTALVAVTTQGFFVYRIHIFSGKNITVPLAWVPLAIWQLVSAFIYVRTALYSANGAHVIQIFKLTDRFFIGIATSSLSVAAVVDVLIAMFLTFLLIRKRTSVGYASTAHILQRLTVFAVNAGIWTATFALLSLILLHIYPSNMLYAVFAFPICSVYCNTLLANLNARAYIRGETTTHKHNVEMDLFTSSASRMSVSTKGEKRPRVVSFRNSSSAEGHGPKAASAPLEGACV